MATKTTAAKKSKPASTAKKSKSASAAKTTAATKAKATAKKAATAKAPAKKTVKKFATAPKERGNITPEQRYCMVAEAAYYRAERQGFMGDPAQDWVAAEAEIAALLSGRN